MDTRPSDQAADRLPPEVGALLSADTEEVDGTAWPAFLEAYSRLMLHVARKSCTGRDAAMDRYAYVLERLREDDFARLRSFEPDGRARFSTWLAVVIRRLCTDFHRRRYGRYTPDSDGRNDDPGDRAAELRRDARRRLVDLVGEAVDIDALGDHRGDPERLVRIRELREVLGGAVSELGDRERLLLALRFEDGHSARLIAEAMEYPSQFHVYRHLKKVLGELRSRLEEQGIDGAGP